MNDIIDNDFIAEEGLHLSAAAKDYLRETSKWAKFLSILGFIAIGLMIVGAISMGSLMGNRSYMGDASIVVMVYFVMAALYFFPVYYLYRFSSDMSLALDVGNTRALTSAFESLKSHYKFIGILAIITIACYILMILFFVFAFSNGSGSFFR